MTLAVALYTQKPIGTASLVDLQEEPVTVLVGSWSRHGCLDRKICEIALNLPPHSLPTHRGSKSVGVSHSPPRYPHTWAWLHANQCGVLRTVDARICPESLDF